MAMAMAEFSNTGTTATLVPGVAGKLIVVTRLVFSSSAGGSVVLKSDAGGGEESDLTPRLFNPSNGVLDLRLGREQGLATQRGKSLGLTSQFSLSTTHSVVVWYELTD